jgi:hypothetical protein
LLQFDTFLGLWLQNFKGIYIMNSILKYISALASAFIFFSCGDHGTEAIYNLERTKEARKTLPTELHGVAKRQLNFIAVATCLKDLSCPPGNRLERLSGS